MTDDQSPEDATVEQTVDAPLVAPPTKADIVYSAIASLEFLVDILLDDKADQSLTAGQQDHVRSDIDAFRGVIRTLNERLATYKQQGQ